MAESATASAPSNADILATFAAAASTDPAIVQAVVDGAQSSAPPPTEAPPDASTHVAAPPAEVDPELAALDPLPTDSDDMVSYKRDLRAKYDRVQNRAMRKAQDAEKSAANVPAQMAQEAAVARMILGAPDPLKAVSALMEHLNLRPAEPAAVNGIPTTGQAAGGRPTGAARQKVLNEKLDADTRSVLTMLIHEVMDSEIAPAYKPYIEEAQLMRQSRTETSWNALAKEYPKAPEYRPQVEALMASSARSGHPLTAVQALMAVSEGKAATDRRAAQQTAKEVNGQLGAGAAPDVPVSRPRGPDQRITNAEILGSFKQANLQNLIRR